MTIEAEIEQGIVELKLDINAATRKKLVQYLMLLQKWNKVYNLTAIRLPKQMISHHLLDSLAVLPHLWEGKWLDVGCGAGLPGLILAIAEPEWEFTLLDSNSKKTSFVQQAIIELELQNAKVICTRAEDWQPSEKFDGIISRAFAELADFVTATRHLLAENGRWVAMKGHLGQEIKSLPDDVKISQKISLVVPGLNATRSLAILKTDQ